METYCLPFKGFSGNHRLCLKGKIFFRNERYLTFQKQVKEYFEPLHIFPRTGPVGMEVTFTFKDYRNRDLDNLAKSLNDSLNGILFKDDSQIKDLYLHKVLDYDKECIEIKIWDI